jgi:hypothetical protein
MDAKLITLTPISWSFIWAPENVAPDNRDRQTQYLAQKRKTTFNFVLFGNRHHTFISQGNDVMAGLLQMSLSERNCFS